MRINLYGSEDIFHPCLCFPLHPSCHIESAAVTSATWGPLQSHVPHFHPQRWSHMFVKMCMLCAFSSPICSHLFFSNEPRSPRGSKPKPHAIYTGRTAGALPAKAWEGDGPGEGERNYHGNFRLNQALAILFLSSLFCLHVFHCVVCLLLLGVQRVLVRSWSCRVIPAARTNITQPLESHFLFNPSFYLFVYFCVFSFSLLPMFSLPQTHFLSPLSMKELNCFGRSEKKAIFPPTALEHILLLCYAGQSRPAVAKLSFLCFFSLFLPPQLCSSCGACPVVNHQVSSLHTVCLSVLSCPVLTACLWTLLPSLFTFTSCGLLSRGEIVGFLFGSFTVGHLLLCLSS